MNATESFAVKSYAVIAALGAEYRANGDEERAQQMIQLMEQAPAEVKLMGALFALGAVEQAKQAGSL